MSKDIKPGDRAIDLVLQIAQAGVAVVVGVPVLEGDVFAGHLDEARAALDQATRGRTTVLVAHRLAD